MIDDFEEAIRLGTERLVHVHRDGIRQRVLGCAGAGPCAGEVTDNLAVDHERQFCPECIVHDAVDIDRCACGRDMYIVSTASRAFSMVENVPWNVTDAFTSSPEMDVECQVPKNGTLASIGTSVQFVQFVSHAPSGE